jgi:hypothetical protein
MSKLLLLIPLLLSPAATTNVRRRQTTLDPNLDQLEQMYTTASKSAEAALTSIPDTMSTDPKVPGIQSTNGYPINQATGGATEEGDAGSSTGATGTADDGTTGSTGAATATAGAGATGGTGSTGGTGGATGGATGVAPGLTNCANGLQDAERTFKANGITSLELPEHIERWCGHLFQRRPHISVSSHVVKKVCSQSRALFEKRPLDSRYSTEYSRSHEFCLHMKVALDKVLSQPESHEFVERKNGLPSRAILNALKPATDVLETGKDKTCCGPHKSPGCFDQHIADCVCKHDRFCCDQEWDKSCASATELYLCAKC